LIGVSFLLGRLMGMSWKKTIGLMLIGWGLAMLSNILRIMLMTIAVVYWGQKSFEFWHGPVGGQIFSGVLFTIYYYVVAGWMNLKFNSRGLSIWRKNIL
jgi:exosortase/archaeosortase family protein